MPLGRKKLKSVQPHRFSIKTLQWLGMERRNIKNPRATWQKIERAQYADIHSHILCFFWMPFSKRMLFHAGRADKKRKLRRYETGERQRARGISHIHKCTRVQSVAFANLLFTARRREARRIHQRECPTTHLAKRAEKNPPSGKKCSGERKLLFSGSQNVHVCVLGSREAALQDAFKFQ
jgi:hypothetical protein